MAAKKEPLTENVKENYYSIEELKKKHNIGKAIFLGMAAQNGWVAGKVVTEKEFLYAKNKFLKGAVDGRRF